MDIALSVIEGPDSGTTFRHLEVDSVILGRGGTPDTKARFPSDSHMSREHLLLECAPGGIVARSLKAGRSFVWNGKPVSECPVEDGDEFLIGRTLMRIDVRDAKPRVRPALDGFDTDIRRRSLDDFEIGDVLGRGALGVVYDAQDKGTGERLAIKMLRARVAGDADAHAYFLREMDVLGRLGHPGIAGLKCIGQTGDEYFIGMECLPGRSLDEHVEVDGSLSQDATRDIGRQMLDALVHAHSLGIVHRDIKPSNVMIWEEGDRLRAGIVDFGLAKNLRDTGTDAAQLTATGETRGTLLYSAPECLQDAKRARAPADIFSVGATLYYALTGETHLAPQSDGDFSLASILDVRLVPVASRVPDIDAHLAFAIERALRADRLERWPSAGAMRRALAGSSSPT